MKVVVQRARNANVKVDGQVVGSIEFGLMVLVGVTHEDTEKDAEFLADKVANLRIFEDEEGKMNLSLLDVGGEVLSVSQFTLYGDCRKGRRPNFMQAAKPDIAEKLYESFNDKLREKGVRVETGSFGAMMAVEFTNVGPVTLIIESK
ncbi:D-tyrosyl-tRNA(Tyr) deacylase [Bacillaceae bacterium ZC4]|mgnify:CR=1 FL=1|uniref:D-aminoacyl-tRNA deacylase n=2 Tax=Aeribacillus TaxID=1055323 RepID=A0A165XND8_9BACI|nr:MULTISPECIES: D-aminoacyl-tRNA deacylase [Aeribacillus]AXI40200.1 D-tyrosyl-tRNA(Tyr) deacylase [Bacillaceae bacterium ZC4]REJ25251.1 MAG: D-tyrosyl-tRNA(Tyr) deacylase [Bacillaceae bacterium]ASS92017.1 D-tyrosyl-tRNA(Tyr) deacylase [Aeribacillus pallidus]KZN96220.1 D-tyrosyl-tRNA(Tyr) deacylase [Aeribacillus pallidus]MED0702075.1 D-aminoacyl-tRNA deacylase [Aeribacillus composti]